MNQGLFSPLRLTQQEYQHTDPDSRLSDLKQHIPGGWPKEQTGWCQGGGPGDGQQQTGQGLASSGQGLILGHTPQGHHG